MPKPKPVSSSHSPRPSHGPSARDEQHAKMLEVAKSPLSKLLVSPFGGYSCQVVSPTCETLDVDEKRDFSEQFPKPRLVSTIRPDDLGIARELGVLPEIADDEVYLVIHQTVRSSSDRGQERIAEMAKYAPYALDVLNPSSPLHAVEQVDTKVTARRVGVPVTRTVLTFEGTPPKDYMMVKLREDMLNNFTRAFNMTMIAAFDPSVHRTRVNVSIDKTMTLLNALGLGYFTFSKDVYKEFSKNADISRQIRLFSRVVFAGKLDDEQVQAAEKQAQLADELLDLWDDMSKEVRFSMRLDRNDLDDSALVESVVRQYADIIDIEPSIEALAAGVPLEDLKFATD